MNTKKTVTKTVEEYPLMLVRENSGHGEITAKNQMVFMSFGCRVYVFMALILALAAYDSLGQGSRGLDADFDCYVQNSMEEWGAAGIMLIVVKDDQIIYQKGYGSRTFGEERPIDENTVLQIASHTKPITATAIAMLVDEGRLSWDDPIKKHIPEFRLPDPYATENATIRDLLSHQVGMPGTPGGFNNPEFCLPELITALSARPMVMKFRERLSFSNAGYAVAGEIVSRVSEVSWEEFIKQRIFAPLEMRSSYTSTPDLIARFGTPTAARNIFMPVEQINGSLVPGKWENNSCGILYAPAGGIFTTANDIAKWMVFQIQNGRYSGKRLVSEDAIWETRMPEVKYDPDLLNLHNPLAQNASYGLGWMSYEYQGRMVYEHPGGWMSSNIAFVPEERLAVGVFTNANFNAGSGSLGLASALKMEVLERLLSGPDEDWNQLFLDARR
jgi:CubicO group peptidase (beta-lactamase class C family)